MKACRKVIKIQKVEESAADGHIEESSFAVRMMHDYQLHFLLWGEKRKIKRLRLALPPQRMRLLN